MNDRPVNLVVALPAEAKPIAAHFGLQRSLPDRGFPLYRRDHLALAVSGPGKLAAAAATGWLGATQDRPEHAAWLNLGIAGHKHRPLGEAVLARCVIDRASAGRWDIPIVFQPPADTETLVTLDRPSDRYDAEAAFEMEAAGFVVAALHFAPPERVHCLKVISDNEAHPAAGINGRNVRQWITGQLAVLELLIERLQALAGPPIPASAERTGNDN